MTDDKRVVLVTGAASGIGRATATRLAADGAAVACVDRDASMLDETVALVARAGGTARPYATDVSDDAQVAAAVSGAVADLGPVSGVVTCAGIFFPGDMALLADVTIDSFLHVLGVNLAGTFSAIKHAMPSLVETRGSIVTIASTAAIRGHGYGSGYTASKGGVAALTRLAAVQYGPQGVRANCICPGGVDTPMTAGVFAGADAAERAKAVPLQAFAQPEQIASVAAFLLSDDASHVTGQTLTVDGGSTIA
jgi:NAD(P)-dependent dehydrogenase (short-subunit alcohol dehydrogenase family)